MTNRFVYQKFREPEFDEMIHHFFYEFYQHLENEFERLAEYILSKQNEEEKIFGKINCEMCICKPNGNLKSEECYQYKTCIEPVILGLKEYLLQECDNV